MHHYSYELGLRKLYSAKALRMGSAFHDGVEAIGNGRTVNDACVVAYSNYDSPPDLFDKNEWDIEAETVARMVSGYAWRWSSMPLEYLAVELPFELPLINPATKSASKTFNLAGKIDAIVRLEDGRIAVKETKLFGDDIGGDSDLWRRMRMDQQVSLYILAARRLGYDAKTVLYDVARKPTIGATDVPVLDSLGAKIVLDKYGDRVKTERGVYRQTGDKEKGYALQTRPMTPEEWGEKLTNDIIERPDFYYRREEIPRLESDLDEFASEVWDVSKTILDANRFSRHYRTVNKNTCSFCSYFDLCSTGVKLTTIAPAGFEFVSNIHPELKTETVHVDHAPASNAQAPAASAESVDSYW